MQNIQQIAQNFLFHLRMGKDPAEDIQTLASLNPSDVMLGLKDDKLKKTFWINLYNAFNLYYLHLNPRMTINEKDRKEHFTTRKLNVAGWKLSMDDIEHGILRRSKIKISLGYINKPFPSALERQLRVDELDYRIHFALNCGGRSCPPIRFYLAEKIEEELDLATQTFLVNESHWTELTKVLRISPIFLWYRRDFGGRKGVVKLFKEKGILKDGDRPSIEYLPYDWHPDSDPFY